MDKHRNRTYGRRRGKTLRPNQKILLDQLLPQIAVDIASIGEEPASQFSFATRTLWLEIGFGGGEHLLDLAARKPDIGFIGCEPFINGVVKVLAGIQEQDIRNIRIHPGDAVDLMEAMPDASLSRIYILYPDPWPKPRQRKRRFITDENIKLMAQKLTAGGQLRFASDISEYCTWTFDKFSASDDFILDHRPRSEWSIPWKNWKSTKYENKARREGRSSAYYIFTRR